MKKLVLLSICFLLTYSCSDDSSSDDGTSTFKEATNAESIQAEQAAERAAEESANSTEEPFEEAQEQIDNTTRMALSLTGSESISIPYHSSFDQWSNDKAFSWSFNIVKDDGQAKFMPIVSRGSSAYYFKYNESAGYIQIGGAYPSYSYFTTVFLSDLTIKRASDGTMNLPITITRSAQGTEKWYIGSQLARTFMGESTSHSAEVAPLLIGAAQNPAYEFGGQIDMLSFWNKELSFAEVVELMTEYDPRDHSAYDLNAVALWTLGEEIDSLNTDGATLYEEKAGLNATATGLSAANFVEVDTSSLQEVVIADTPLYNNLVHNASTNNPIDGATISLIGLDATYTTLSDEYGNFEFSNIPELSYIMSVSAPGFVTYYRNFHKDDATRIMLVPEFSSDLTDSSSRIVTSWSSSFGQSSRFVYIYDENDNYIGLIDSIDTSYSDANISIEYEGNYEDSELGVSVVKVNNMSSDYGVKFAFGVQSVDQDLSTSDLMFTMYRGNEFYGEYGVANARNPSSNHEEWFGLTTLKGADHYHDFTYQSWRDVTSYP